MQISLLNRAIYYWDWYLLHGDIDNLVAASCFMSDYRKSGGTDYVETEAHIKAHVEAKTSPLPKAGKVPTYQPEQPKEHLIFGYTTKQIARMQGGASDLK